MLFLVMGIKPNFKSFLDLMEGPMGAIIVSVLTPIDLPIVFGASPPLVSEMFNLMNMWEEEIHIDADVHIGGGGVMQPS